MVVGAIVAVADLPSKLGLTHERHKTHPAITLDPVNLSHQTLATFSRDLGSHDSAALHPLDQASHPRLALVATSDGALLAQIAPTGEDGPTDQASPDAAAPDVGGTDGDAGGGVGQDEPAPDPDGYDETSPAPAPTPTVDTTPPATTQTTETDMTETPSEPGERSLPQSAETKVPSPDVPIVIPDQIASEDLQQIAQEVQEETGLAGEDCAKDLTRCPGLTAMIGAALTDSTGAPVPVAVAAERLKRALPQMRKVDGPDGPTVDGIGVDVTVHADDLEGKTIYVKWQLFERGGGALQLYGDWLSANSVYRLVPSSDDVDTDLPLWVPWPPGRGRYGIRLLIYVDGTRFTHKDVPLE